MARPPNTHPTIMAIFLKEKTKHSKILRRDNGRSLFNFYMIKSESTSSWTFDNKIR